MSNLPKDSETLIQEIEENKQRLHQLVNKLEKIAENMDSLIPKKIDYKTMYVAAERAKIVSSMYETILKYRSEITNQIKEQFNIIKSIETKDDIDKFKELVSSMQTDQALELLKSLPIMEGQSDEQQLKEVEEND